MQEKTQPGTFETGVTGYEYSFSSVKVIGEIHFLYCAIY
jgi:hypothetical protein